MLKITLEAFRPETSPKLVRYDCRSWKTRDNGKVMTLSTLSATREAVTAFLELRGLSAATARGLVTLARTNIGEQIDLYI